MVSKKVNKTMKEREAVRSDLILLMSEIGAKLQKLHEVETSDPEELYDMLHPAVRTVMADRFTRAESVALFEVLCGSILAQQSAMASVRAVKQAVEKTRGGHDGRDHEEKKATTKATRDEGHTGMSSYA